MGKTSATGSFRLLIGVAVSTIIMAIGSIVLGNLLSQDEYGLYGIVVVPSALIILFRDWGVNSAMTKYIASLRAAHREDEIHDYVVAGLIFEVASGIALSFLSLLLASFIASFYHKPESASYIAIVSVSIVAGSLLAASQAGFVGYERMGLNSLTLIAQAVAKTLVGPALVFIGYSVLGAIIGYVLGFVVAGIIGLTIFYLALLRPLRKNRTKKSNLIKTLKIMLHYGVPLSIGSMLAGVLGQIYAFTIIPLTTNAMYGNYLIAANFAVLLTFFTIPINTVLFPAFAKLDPDNESELLKNVFASSVKYASIIVIPAATVLMVLSGPMIGTLFGGKYVYAPLFLTLSVAGAMFAVIGNLSAGGFLSGVGETKTLMILNIITIVVGIPLGLMLIPTLSAWSPTLGIIGYIIASVFAGVPSMLWGLYWIWKHYKAKADFASSAKILAASAIAAVLAYLPTVFLNAADWIKLVIGLIIFLAAYIFGAPMIGAVSLTDINNLRTMFSSMSIISKIINIPLKAAEKAAQTKSANRKAGEKP